MEIIAPPVVSGPATSLQAVVPPQARSLSCRLGCLFMVFMVGKLISSDLFNENIVVIHDSLNANLLILFEYRSTDFVYVTMVVVYGGR